MSPSMAMNTQEMNELPPLQHRPLSSQAHATPSHSTSSSSCLAGKKHASTPPPPIPARSPRRPVISSSSTSPAAAAHGIKLFKSNDFDEKNVGHEGAAAFDTGERSLNGGDVGQSPLSQQHQPSCQEQQQPRQAQHRRRRSVLDDIDYEASNVCEFIKGNRTGLHGL